MYINLHEYEHDLISNYLIYSKYVYEYKLKQICYELFENMLNAGLPHTAAPLDSRTLPHALPDSRTLPCTLLRTLLHLPDTAVRSAAHGHTLHGFECRTAAHRTPHTSHRTQSHTVTNMIFNNST
jgi:hypothetical protein